MKRILYIVLLLSAVSALEMSAQVDRREVRKGNRDFKKENYREADIEYRKYITPLLLHYIHRRTSICLFVSCDSAPYKYHAEAKTMGQKTTLYPNTNQHTQSKGQHHTAPKLVLPAHKNTPCTLYAGGVVNLTAKLIYGFFSLGIQHCLTFGKHF